jgi:phage terminase small subunit
MDTSPPLTRRQLEFVRYYKAGHSKSEAARLAGYTPVGASNIGSALARDPRILALVKAEEPPDGR